MLSPFELAKIILLCNCSVFLSLEGILGECELFLLDCHVLYLRLDVCCLNWASLKLVKQVSQSLHFKYKEMGKYEKLHVKLSTPHFYFSYVTYNF